MHFIHSQPESLRGADSRETTLNDSRTSGTRGKPEEHRAARAPQSSAPASSRPPPRGGMRMGDIQEVSAAFHVPLGGGAELNPLQPQCAPTNGAAQGKPGSAAPRARTAFAVPPRCPRQSHFLFQFLYPGSRRRYPRREHAAALPDKATPASPETFAAPSRFAKRRGCHIRGAHTCTPRDRVCPLPSLSSRSRQPPLTGGALGGQPPAANLAACFLSSASCAWQLRHQPPAAARSSGRASLPTAADPAPSGGGRRAQRSSSGTAEEAADGGFFRGESSRPALPSATCGESRESFSAEHRGKLGTTPTHLSHPP